MAERLPHHESDLSITPLEKTIRVLEKKAGVPFPSKDLPPTPNGTGRALFNRINHEDPAYDPEHPFTKVLEALLPEGEAPVEEVVERTGIPPEQIKTIAGVRNVIEVFPGDQGEIVVAEPLKAYLEELKEKNVTHPLLEDDMRFSAD